MKLMFPGLLFLFKKRSFACTEEYKGVLDTLVKKFFNKPESTGNLSHTAEHHPSKWPPCVLITSPTFLKMLCVQKGWNNEEQASTKHVFILLWSGSLSLIELIPHGPSQKSRNLNPFGSTTLSCLRQQSRNQNISLTSFCCPIQHYLWLVIVFFLIEV